MSGFFVRRFTPPKLIRSLKGALHRFLIVVLPRKRKYKRFHVRLEAGLGVSVQGPGFKGFGGH